MQDTPATGDRDPISMPTIHRTRRQHTVETIVITTLIGLTFIVGTAIPLGAQPPAPGCAAPRPGLAVPANQPWTETSIHVQEGDVVTISARGAVTVQQKRGWLEDDPRLFGPEGTFFFEEAVAEKPFPLPAAAKGPASCYCLIGRIGNGRPFYVGRHRSWMVERSGRLWLGINDFNVGDNAGRWRVNVTKSAAVRPVRFEERLPQRAPAGEPVEGASVVVFYVDGLRPDVVREMVAMGHLPNIRRHFLQNGAWLSNAFTAFPSDTITSNGTMWTGCFSDRHGLKGQVRFDRQNLESASYLEPLGPSRSARQLAPQGIDKLWRQTRAATIRMMQGRQESRGWKRRQTSGVDPLYKWLDKSGQQWATGVLPLMPEMPPLLWSRSVSRFMPYLRGDEVWQHLDDANTRYTLKHLLHREARVTVLWLPETDSASHKKSRGQFGMTRRTIARADRLIGEVIEELKARGRFENTYLMLVSDHGHHGGRRQHLRHFDLANEFFYKPREITSSGKWVGGGLGLSVRRHRQWNRHPGDGDREFVFLDGYADGVARVFLPQHHYRSGQWNKASRPGDLLAYRLDRRREPINLVRTLTHARMQDADGKVHRPVDLVAMKLTVRSVLISTANRGNAVIRRRRNNRGEWVYRYTVVDSLRPTANGRVHYREVDEPQVDPLGLLQIIPADTLGQFRTERQWLQITAETRYPDSVVAFSRALLWQRNLADWERRYAPDLLVTAKPGWFFGVESSPGSMHGYPLADSMRVTWMIAGPNIRRGVRIERPCRLVDLTPTILQMAGVRAEPSDFDGSPLRSIYQAGPGSTDFDVAGPKAQDRIRTSRDSQGAGQSTRSHSRLVAASRSRWQGVWAPRSADYDTVGKARVNSLPVYWSDVDLNAWQELDYRPIDESPYKPFSINRPENPFDLNNMAYSAVSVGDLSVFRLVDDVFILPGREEPVTQFVERMDRQIRRSESPWLAEAGQALNVSGLAVSDYKLTSLGNMQRMNGAVNWIQQRELALDARLAAPLGREHLPGTLQVHAGIDGVQQGFWEIYRFGQRMIVKILNEVLLNGIENQADRSINTYRQAPAEVLVEEE